MSPQIPNYLHTFDIISQPILPIITLGLIWIGAARMDGNALVRYLTASALSAVLIAWAALAYYLGSANVYFLNSDAAIPTLMLGLLVPLIVAALAFVITGIGKLVFAIPLPLLVAAQVFRVEGGIFLILWADGRLPWQFAMPAGIGDVATAFLAIMVAIQLAKQTTGASRSAFVWNLFGVADLVVALAMGALTSPGRAHLFSLDAPNLLVSSYPLVMIPTFGVPLALILHGIVLSRLRSKVPTGMAVRAAALPPQQL